MERMKSTLTNFLTIEYELPGARAFSTQRGCADASDAYDGLSVCHYVDAPDHIVEESRRIVANEFSVTPERLVIPRQTHSSAVAVIDDTYPDINLDGIDAMVTRRNDIVLCINTADCVPVVLCDPIAGVLGIAHSGWRGTVSRISALTIDEMCRQGALPQHIHAVMGPCICPDCFEVGKEVASIFKEEFPFVSGIVMSGPGKPHVDLPEAIRVTLIEAGLPTGYITMPPACSHCNPALYFSARRLGIKSGRTLTAARLL